MSFFKTNTVSKLAVVIALFLLLLSGFSGSVYSAKEINITEEKINPGSFFYNFKRLAEKVSEIIIFSSSKKARYHFELMEKRLAELKYVSDRDLLSEFESASNRFSYEAGKATELLKKSGEENGKKEEFQNKFSEYSDYLPTIRDRYELHSSFWRLAQQNIDTLNILKSQLD